MEKLLNTKKNVIENSFESKLTIIGECGHAHDIF
jgi:hypothetical protein